MAFRVRAQRHPWTAWGSGLCSQQPAGPQRALRLPGSRGDPLTVAVSPPGGCRLQPRRVITAKMSGESRSGLCSGGSCVSVPLGHVPGRVSPPHPPAAPLGAQLMRLLPQWVPGSTPSTEQTGALGSHSGCHGPARFLSEAGSVVDTLDGPEVWHRGSSLYTGDTFRALGGCS